MWSVIGVAKGGPGNLNPSLTRGWFLCKFENNCPECRDYFLSLLSECAWSRVTRPQSIKDGYVLFVWRIGAPCIVMGMSYHLLFQTCAKPAPLQTGQKMNEMRKSKKNNRKSSCMHPFCRVLYRVQTFFYKCTVIAAALGLMCARWTLQ